MIPGWIRFLGPGILLLGVATACTEGESGPDGEGLWTNPTLEGEELTDPTECEGILSANHLKRRTTHFVFETNTDSDACRELAAFCERCHSEFLDWAGLPRDTDLWGRRAAVVLLHGRATWAAAVLHWTKGRSLADAERLRDTGVRWTHAPPAATVYARMGSPRRMIEGKLFHVLNHLFLIGLGGSKDHEMIWWLWEGFSAYRALEVLGWCGTGCKWVSSDDRWNTVEDRHWYDRERWGDLLAEDVRAGNDPDFVRFFMEEDFDDLHPKYEVKALSLIRWFVRNERQKALFIEFVSRLGTPADQAGALEKAYGMSPTEVEESWRAWIVG